MCFRATVSLSAQRQELLHEGVSLRANVLVEGLTNYIMPIKMINFKAIVVISALLLFVLR